MGYVLRGGWQGLGGNLLAPRPQKLDELPSAQGQIHDADSGSARHRAIRSLDGTGGHSTPARVACPVSAELRGAVPSDRFGPERKRSTRLDVNRDAVGDAGAGDRVEGALVGECVGVLTGLVFARH